MKKVIATLALCGLAIPSVFARDYDLQNQTEVYRMVRDSFNGFKNAKLSRKFSKNGKYYTGYREKKADATAYRYYWEQNLCQMATSDQADYAGDRLAARLSDELCEGFWIHYDNSWGLGWNEYIDDQLWLALSLIRAYRNGGNERWLEGAKTVFDTLFERGCHGPGDIWEELGYNANDGTKGLWWKVLPDVHKELTGNFSNLVKSPLSNSGVAALGAYIYQATGDQEYLTKAVNIWNWVANTLYDHYDQLENSGQPKEGVSEGWRPEYHGMYGGKEVNQNQFFQGRRTLHDQSTFLEATNALYQVTKDQKYMDWCETILFDIFNRRVEKNTGKQVEQGYITGWHDFGSNGMSTDGAWCWEVARAMTMFVVDNNAWDMTTFERKVGESPLNGTTVTIPRGWTLYEWMCHQATRLIGDTETCIILPLRDSTDANYLEAEDAEFDETTNKKITIVDDNLCSGGKKITNFGKGSTVTFTYNAPEAGVYDLALGYGMKAPKSTLSVSINGNTSDTFDLNTTGAGNDAAQMDEFFMVVPLAAGKNTITIEPSRTTPGIDVDYLYIIPEGGSWVSNEYEAEDQTLIGGATVRKFANASNGQLVTVNAGDGVEWNVSLPSTACYEMTLRYSSAKGGSAVFSTASGEKTIELPSTGNRNVFNTVSFKANFAAGSNKMTVKGAENLTADLDYALMEMKGVTDLALSAVEEIGSDAENLPADDSWYTLMGVRIDAPSAPGIYIHNGKKVLVK